MFSVTDVSLEKNTKVNHLWVVGLGGGRVGEADSSAALRNDKQSMPLQNDAKRWRAAGDVWGWGVEWAVFAGWEVGFVFR